MNMTAAAHKSSGLALLVIATAQLMLVLDDTIANIALPSIQREFALSPSALPWVINAYILAFGGLLLLGGKLGDLVGRRRTLQIGLLVFTVASVVAGLAWSGETLIAARAFQGIGAALAAPNLLALIATSFPQGPARNKALAVYAAMSGIGIIGGLLLGGVLAATLGWRSVFLINLPIGLAVLTGTCALADAGRGRGRLDIPGALTGTAGLVALVYGITNAGEAGWNAPATIVATAMAVVLLVAFLLLQRAAHEPMLPLSVFADRNRAGSYVATLFIGAGLMGSFYLLTLYLQNVAGFDPLQTGLACLPFSAGIILGSGVGSKLIERLSPRVIAAPALLMASGALFWLSAITPDASYFAQIMTPLLLTSFGLGLSFVVLTLTSVHAVTPDIAGVASSLVNTAQQIGAALGLAVFTAVSASVTLSLIDSSPRAVALTNGYSAAFAAAAIALAVAALVVVATVTTPHPQNAESAAPR